MGQTIKTVPVSRAGACEGCCISVVKMHSSQDHSIFFSLEIKLQKSVKQPRLESMKMLNVEETNGRNERERGIHLLL